MPTLTTFKPTRSPELLRRDFELWEQEIRDLPELQKRLGKTALEGTTDRSLHNHDPLAHIWQLSEAGDITPELLLKFKTEFISDMGERSPENGFYHAFTMRHEGDDIVSSTGVSMRSSLLGSVEATKSDAVRDERRAYGLEREMVQLNQLDQILRWAGNDLGNRFFGFASLCPPDTELAPDIAKANGFKPDRLMASLWIYEKEGTDLSMHALSLDHCTLDRFQRLLAMCTIPHVVEATTLDQLGKAITYDGVGIDDLRRAWKTILHEDSIDTVSTISEANEVAESRPEAFQVYLKFVIDVTASLATGRVNKNLSKLLREARQSEGAENVLILQLRRFRRFDQGNARDLMEFVRSRMIPHYIYGLQSPGGEGAVLGASGSSAVRPEGTYDGACPSSNFESQTSELASLSSSGMVHRQLVVDSLLNSRRNGNCLTCGKESTTVYGCGLCGRCNKIWCDEYKSTGKGLDIKEIKKMITPVKPKKTAKPKKSK